jgi:hypothetical protein
MCAASYLISSAVLDGGVGNGSFNSIDNIFCGWMSRCSSYLNALVVHFPPVVVPGCKYWNALYSVNQEVFPFLNY